MIKRRYGGRTTVSSCPFSVGRRSAAGSSPGDSPQSSPDIFDIGRGSFRPSVRPSIHVIPEQQLETDRRRRRLLVMQDSGGTGTEGGREAGWRASKVGCPGYRFFRGKYARFTPSRTAGVRPTSSRVGGSLSLLPSLKKLCILCSLAPHPARSRSFGRSVLI